MRATRLPIPVLQTATCRRSLAALIAVALLVGVPGAMPAMDVQVIQGVSQYAKLLLAQEAPAKDPAKAEPAAKQPDAKESDTKEPAPKAPPKKEPSIGRARGKKPTAPVVAPKKNADIDPQLTRDKAKLPAGYKVPPEKLPDIEIRNEIPFAKKPARPDPAWRQHTEKFKKYKDLLVRGTLTDTRTDKETLRYGIQWRLYQMTQISILAPTDEDREKIKKAQEEDKPIPEPETIEHLRDELLKDLDRTNQANNGAFEVRDAFLDVLCEEAPKLLDNNFYVRFNVAEILCSINNRDEMPERGILEEPCFRAIKALLALVNDPKQHSLYKLHPVQALAKICRHKNCKTDDRFAIIDCLMKQMTAAKTLPEWYGMRVAESLGQVEPYDRTRQPVVVDALMSVLKDGAYSYRVRVEAGHSLGRVPLEAYRKSDDIAIELLRLASQMATDQQKSIENPRWRLYFSLVYFAFQPSNATERAEKKGLLAQVDSKPTLAGTKTVVTEAYQLFIPLARNVLGSKDATPITEQLRKIKPWLDAHSKGPGNGNPVAAGNN